MLHKSFEGFELSMFQMAYNFSISFITSWLKHENGRLRIFLSYWFNFGSAFMCLGVVVSPYFLWVSIFNLTSVFSLNYKIYDSEVNIVETSATITPIIPGICFKAISIKLYFTFFKGLNFPGRYVFGFWASTLLVACFHEFGHALAAVRENLQVRNAGIFFVFALPGISTQLD